VAEGTALLKLHRGNPIGGSNPPLSAILPKALQSNHFRSSSSRQPLTSQNTSRNTDADVGTWAGLRFGRIPPATDRSLSSAVGITMLFLGGCFLGGC
jgi:hypothetical protein